MTDATARQNSESTEKKIGRTTYIVTSHFQDKGSTAVDKIRCLLDTNTKTGRMCQNQ